MRRTVWGSSGRRALVAACAALAMAFAVGLAASSASGLAIVVDNGLAPPNPANVIDAAGLTAADSVLVRDSAGGQPTAVEIVDSAGGTAFGGVQVTDASTLVLSGGAPMGITALGSSTLIYRGGSSESAGVVVRDAATLLLESGGPSEGLDLLDASHVEVTGGAVGTDLGLGGSASGVLRGGTVFGFLSLRDDARFTWLGGEIDPFGDNGVVVQGSALLRISGSDFALGGRSLLFGPLAGDREGLLTGTLASGDPFAVDLLLVGDRARVLLAPVPEPSSAALLAAAGLCALGLRRRWRPAERPANALV